MNELVGGVVSPVAMDVRHRGRAGQSCALLLGLALGWIIGMTPVLTMPVVDRPATVDVVEVLGPPEQWRIDRAFAFARTSAEAGHPSNMLISLWHGQHLPECDQSTAQVHVYCTTVEPFTTQGEARWLRDAMQRHGWHTALAITSTPHASRARLIVNRCVPQAGMYSEAHLRPIDWVQHYVYQSGAYLKATFVTTGC